MNKILSAVAFLALFNSIHGQEKFTDKRDGNIYSIINVGESTWMAENLKFTVREGADSFDNDSNNIPVYGLLYDWETAVAICPSGWHLPSGEEFQDLVDNFASKKSWGKIPSEPSFSVQLGGLQDYEGTFSEMGESGYYWTSTEYDKCNAEYFSYLVINDIPVIDISRKQDIADVRGTEKLNRYSVRCVKD
jgi:uncharacterized protein (TIGR02145 family)